MKFIERLTQAITDKNIKTVNAMLQALQVLYAENDFSIAFSLETLITLPNENNKVRFSRIILETDIEIFKSFMWFFKSISTLEIFKNPVANDLVFTTYKVIFLRNSVAIKFLINDIGVDLLKPSLGFKRVWFSPLEAADDDLEIFQFLLPLCVDAYEEAGKDIFKDLLEPILIYLKSEKANTRDKKSRDILKHEIKLIKAFQGIYAIFSGKSKNIATLYSSIGQFFPLYPEFSLRLIGNFLHTVANQIIDSQDKSEIDINLLELINILTYTLITLINKSDNPKKLKGIFEIEILPHYLAIASKFKQFELDDKNLKYYKLILENEGLIQNDFHKKSDNPEKKSEEDDTASIHTIKIEVKDTNILPPPTDEAIYELANIYFIDQEDLQKTLSLLFPLAERGHREACNMLLSFPPQPQSNLQFNIYIQIGHLYHQGTANNVVTSDLGLALTYWEKALSVAFKDKVPLDSVAPMEKALIEIAYNTKISSDLCVSACSLLLNFHLLSGKTTNILQIINHAILIFLQAKLPLPDPLFPNIIKELSILLYNPKYQDDCLELFAFIETATQTSTQINITNYIENIESLFTIAHAIRKGHAFDENSFRAAQVYLKIFELCTTPELQKERHTASTALKDLITENNSIAVSLAISLYKIILEKKLIDDHLEFATEILGIAANCGSTECLQALDILYKQYLNSDKTSFKIVLSRQFLVLAKAQQINSKLSEKTIETLLIKAITLAPNISVPLTLHGFKISILNIFKLRDQLNSWISEALPSFNKDNFKSSPLNFFTKNKINPSLQLHSIISAMNELSNCITTFLKYGEAELNLKSFSKNTKTASIHIKEIKDIHTAVKIFIVNNQNNLSMDKDNLLSKLLHLLQNYLEERAAEPSLEFTQFKW